MENVKKIIEKEILRMGFIEDSDNVDRFLDTIAEDFNLDVENIKDNIMNNYKHIYHLDDNGCYTSFYYLSEQEFESIQDFFDYFELGE